MSTEDSAPLTRAQLRALREAESVQAAQAPAEVPSSEPASSGTAEPTVEAAPATPVPPIPLPTTPVDVGVRLPEPEDAEEEQASQAPPALPAPSRRPFLITLGAVLTALVLLVAGLGVVSLTQGPRISEVQVDPAQAVDTSGSRVTLILNQRVTEVDASQVSIEPATGFTVDSAGRSLGIRFTSALNDATTYKITVAGVRGTGGGPTATLATTFTTPKSRILLLQRSPGDENDTIFTTDLSGKRATPVFTHPRIDDYRATGNLIVVAVEEHEGSRLIVMNRDGSGERDLKLPGEGFVSSIQVSDRGGFVGYSYSDRDLTETSGRASILATSPLSGGGKPRIVQINGQDASIAEWQFVPDTSSILFIDFDGALGVQRLGGSAEVKPMGVAASILGVTPATYTAIVERTDGSIVQLSLTDGVESPFPPSDPDYGDAANIVPFPGGTLRHVVQRDADGMPTGQAVVRVDDTGKATVVTETGGSDAILQTCVSPSGQYVAVVVAPDLPNNPYDDLLFPLPETMHTQLFDLSGKKQLPVLNGFDISWCSQPPRP